MLIPAFILGFLGSFHCVGMCGPIAFMLPVNRKNKTIQALQTGIYHIGRLCAYGFIGLIFGSIGKGLFIRDMQQKASIIAGVLMIITMLIPYKSFAKYNGSKTVFKLLSSLKSQLAKQLKKKNTTALFLIGLFNGFLPCAMVYMALFGAIAMTDIPKAITYMLSFGLGTIPLMSAAAYLGNFLSTATKTRIKKVVPILVIGIGMLFILRGLGLGIPYISPANTDLMITARPSCIVK